MKTSNKILLVLSFIAVGLLGWIYNTYAVGNYDISTMTLTGDSYDAGTSYTSYDVVFKEDGTTAIILYFASSYYMRQVNLSTPYDLSTASFYDSFTPSLCNGIDISDDGTTIICTRVSSDIIFQYTMDAWDLTTISYDTNYTTGQGSLDDVYWVSSTKVLVKKLNNAGIFYLDLATPWDISSASVGDTGNIYYTSGNSIALSSDGYHIYFTRSSSTLFYDFTLATAFDITDVSSSTSYDLSTPNGGGFQFIEGENLLYWYEDTGEVLYEISVDFTDTGEPCQNTLSCTNTRIEWNYPTDGTFTASRSIDFSLTYYFNSTTHDSSTYDKLLILACSLIDVSPYNQSLNTCEQLLHTDGISYDSTTSSSVNFTLNTDGAYLLIAEFWNGVASASSCAWWNIFCDEEQVEVLVPNAININVATEAISFDAIQSAVGRNILSGFCGDTNAPWYDITELLPVYFCQVLVHLFYPTATIGNTNAQFEELQRNLNTKLPFALYYRPYNALYQIQNVTASDSYTFTIPLFGYATPSIDLVTWKDNYGDFLDVFTTYINYILWFWFGLYVFRDLTHKDK